MSIQHIALDFLMHTTVGDFLIIYLLAALLVLVDKHIYQAYSTEVSNAYIH